MGRDTHGGNAPGGPSWGEPLLVIKPTMQVVNLRKASGVELFRGSGRRSATLRSQPLLGYIGREIRRGNWGGGPCEGKFLGGGGGRVSG